MVGFRTPDASDKKFHSRLVTPSHSTCFGPTTPTHPEELPLGLGWLDRMTCKRTLFAAERLLPSARERVQTISLGRTVRGSPWSCRVRRTIRSRWNLGPHRGNVRRRWLR